MAIDRIRSLSKDLLWYGLSNMLYSLVQLLSMPLVVRSMSMGEVADWNILLPTGVLLSAVVTCGMDSSIVRFVVDRDESERKVIYSTGLLFVMGLTCLLGFSLWLFAPSFIGLIKLSAGHTASFFVLLCWLPGVILSQFCQNWLKYSFQRTRFIRVMAIQSFIYVTLILIFRLTGRLNLFNVMCASVASVWTASALGLFFSRGLIGWSFDKALLGRMLRYGFPFMILAFGFNLIFSVDKYLLAGKVSPAEFAVYSQAFRVAAIFSMIVSTFNFAFGPFSLSVLNKDDAPDTFGYLRSMYLGVMCLTGLLFISFDKVFLLQLAGPNYLEGSRYLPLFVFGYILYGLYSFAQLGMIHSKQSHLSLYVLFFSLAGMVGFNLLTIPALKGYGTAWGFALGNLIMVLFAGWMSRKFFRINANNFKDALLFTFCLACALANPLLFPADNLYLAGSLKALVYLGLFGLLFGLPLFKPERTVLRQALSRG